VANDLARIGLLLRSLEYDRAWLGKLFKNKEAVEANRTAGFDSTARVLEAMRAARIAKLPQLVETERIVLERIARTTEELQQLGVRV